LNGNVFVRDTKESVGILNIPYQKEKVFLPDIPRPSISKDLIVQMDKASIHSMTSPQILTSHLSFILKKYASEFIGSHETRFSFETFEKSPRAREEGSARITLTKNRGSFIATGSGGHIHSQLLAHHAASHRLRREGKGVHSDSPLPANEFEAHCQ
jgi:hypothetical protein